MHGVWFHLHGYYMKIRDGVRKEDGKINWI